MSGDQDKYTEEESKDEERQVDLHAYHIRQSGDHLLLGFWLGIQKVGMNITDTRVAELFTSIDKKSKPRSILRRLQRTRDSWYDSLKTKEEES